ncbi:MAG TPA: DUF4129 domain-containing protein [Anaerolineales bacterium]|jgi:hypothetical protein
MRRRAVLLSLIAGLLVYPITVAWPALAFSVSSQPVHPQASRPLTEEEYWKLVEHNRQIVAGLKGAPARKMEDGLSKLAAQWQRVETIRLTTGEVIPFDNSFMLATLGAEKPDLDHIKHLLEQLQAAHQQYPRQVFTTDDLKPLALILARPEFQWQEARPNPVAAWLAKQWERLLQWLSRLFGGRTITLNTGTWSFPAALTTLLLVLVLLYISRNLIRDFVSDARLDSDGSGSDEALTSERAFQRAMDLSRGRDYRSAVRYLYLSSLLMLDERNLLQYDRSKTNREYLRSISGSPELAEPLGQVIEVFDDVWYGHHSLDEDSFKHYSDRVEALKEQSK